MKYTRNLKEVSMGSQGEEGVGPFLKRVGRTAPNAMRRFAEKWELRKLAKEALLALLAALLAELLKQAGGI